MPTIKDVAERACVSPNTVSRVINGAENVAPALRDRVHQAVRELGYVPNVAARSLRSKRTRWLALVVPDITDAHWHSVARGVEDAARSRGYAVLFCNTDENPTKQQQYLEVATSQSVAGVILVPAHPDARQLATLRDNSIPTVCINRRVTGWEVDTVFADARSAARALVGHLIAVGHRRIAVLTGPTYHSGVQDRIEGYYIALAEAGIPIDPRLVKSGEYQAATAESLTYQLLNEGLGATAIFAANVNLALGVIHALGKRGLRIPQDVALVCFGDLKQAYLPFLTCILEPAYEMGANAAQLLFTRLDSVVELPPRQVILPTRLVVRYSCGRAVSAEDEGPTLAPSHMEDAQPVLVKALTPEELASHAALVGTATAFHTARHEQSSRTDRSDVQRLISVLQHGTPDRPPHLQLWTPTRSLVEHVLRGKPLQSPDVTEGPETLASPEEHVQFAQRLGIDAVVCRYARHLQRNSVRTWADLDHLDPPPSLSDYLACMDRYLTAARGTGVGLVASFSHCLYEAVHAVGLDNGARMPDGTERLLRTLIDILVEQQERVIRAVSDRFAGEVALVMFEDDHLPSAEVANMATLTTDILPVYIDRLVRITKEHDKLVLMQAMGDPDTVLPMLFEIDVDAAYVEQLAAAELAHLKKKWHDKLALVSTFPTHELASCGQEQIQNTIREYCATSGSDGGCIVSTAMPGAAYPAQCFIALCDAIRRLDHHD